jgi:hypothetical protein
LTELLNPAAISYGGTASTSMTTLGFALAQNPSLIDEATFVPIGIFIAGICSTAFLVWRVANQKSKYEMDMFQLKKRIEALEQQKEKQDTEQ